MFIYRKIKIGSLPVTAFYEIIDIGSQVKVIDEGCTYTSHENWIKENKPSGCRWVRHQTPENGDIGFVVCCGDHSKEDPKPLYGVLFGHTHHTHKFYVLDGNGIQVINESKLSINEVSKVLSKLSGNEVQANAGPRITSNGTYVYSPYE
jgi:hypothetical protein